MRRLITGLLVCVTLFFTTYSQAQEKTENPGADEEKSVNLYAQPLGLLFGILAVGGEIGVARSVTMGPSLGLLSRISGSTKYSGGEIGFHTDFYLGHKRFTDSWVLAPFLDVASIKISQDPYNSVTLPGGALGFDIGYRWFWPSGFNLGLALALGTYSFSSSTNLTDNNGNTISVSTPYSSGYYAIDFSLGYAF